jgi:uncharacterized protein YbjQ (UPF0145 family)
MFDLYWVIGLVVVGFVVGQYLERRHYRSIEQREQELIELVTTNSKKPLGQLPQIRQAKLVNGSVVISVDYFKRMLATLRGFFGGNIRAYETLVDRARREAILRLKESCPDATQIINLRIETSSIYKGSGDQVGSVEVLAYATAIYV